ncbi:diaminopimelate epimerase [Lederbergia graminis]|uniref:Diaminopimelate epimerase n=1 Tax=Lederbergia graminis TaxID=735518 RepID=A0ABW0LGW2_9BACI|nr:diaminopimelate epimerase [Paenibacillus bovis]HLU21833.1 diaminopimelate epimerase [Bacillaceae bacterium]
MLFTKMHGLGNAYVIFNQLDEPIANQSLHELSKRVSDVNFGIGSDGIILISPSKVADYQMRIFNEDGSEAKNCGNGLRCVAKFLYDHMYATSRKFTIETLGGIVSVEVDVDQKHKVRTVTVDMGEPKLLKGMIPMLGDPVTVTLNEAHQFGDYSYHITAVSMGNPHAIIFVDDIKQVPLEIVGPLIENSSLFPERVNVGFVQIINSHEIDYRVWERGSGITMACGTGACAAVVAATLNKKVDKHVPITVHLPGGDLTISWDEHGHVWKRGPANYVCHGELDVSMMNTDINPIGRLII